jgi:hypothetical protein
LYLYDKKVNAMQEEIMKRFITYALIIFFAAIISTNGFVLATSAAPNDPMFGQQWGHNNTGQQI